MKKYSRLILLLAFLLVSCKTSVENKAFSWVTHSCVFTGTIDSPGLLQAYYPTEYNGTFRCTNPDGSKLTCPGTNQPADRVEFTTRVTYPRDITEENFWVNMGCGSSSVATPTPTATLPAPTATATEPAPAPASSAPVLTGDVTACNIKEGFINFQLVDASSGLSGSDVYLTINGTQVNCTVAGNNKDLLSCPLPSGVSFPAQIHAAVGDTSTDDFTFDGGGCVTQVGPSGGDAAAPTCAPGADCY